MPTSFHWAQMNVVISQIEKLRQRDKHQAGVSGLFNQEFRNSTKRWASLNSFLSCLKFFWPHQAAYGILVPCPGIEPVPPGSGKLQVLITGLSGKSLLLQFSNWFFSSFSVHFFFFFFFLTVLVAACRIFVVLCGIFPCGVRALVAGGRLSYSKACGVLIPRPGIKPVPYTRRQILNHWTTRESPLSCFWSRDFKWFFKWRNLSRDCLIKYHPLHHGPLEFWSLWRLPKSVITDVNAYRKKPVGKYKRTNQAKCSIAGRGEVCGKLECMNFHIPIKL